MPWNGSGVFGARVYSWAADRDAGLDILADRMDTDTDDIAQGLMHCLTVNGETVPVANLPMANFRHTGASGRVSARRPITPPSARCSKTAAAASPRAAFSR